MSNVILCMFELSKRQKKNSNNYTDCFSKTNCHGHDIKIKDLVILGILIYEYLKGTSIDITLTNL